MSEIQDDDTYEEALEQIRKVFADSREVIALFIGYARGHEIAPTQLVSEADRVLATLTQYSCNPRISESGQHAISKRRH